jgi:hypothetical protein
MYFESCAVQAAESLLDGSADMHIAWESGVAIAPQHWSNARQAGDDDELPSLLHAGAIAAPAHAAIAQATMAAPRVMPMHGTSRWR